MGNPVSVTLASATTSDPVALNWRTGGFTSIYVISGGSTGYAYTVQYTLDDLQLVGGSSLATWVSDPNMTAVTSASSDVILYQKPLAAIRLNSTTLSTATAGGLILRVLQNNWA